MTKLLPKQSGCIVLYSPTLTWTREESRITGCCSKSQSEKLPLRSTFILSLLTNKDDFDRKGEVCVGLAEYSLCITPYVSTPDCDKLMGIIWIICQTNSSHMGSQDLRCCLATVTRDTTNDTEKFRTQCNYTGYMY